MQTARRIIAALGFLLLGSAATMADEGVTRVDTYHDWTLMTDTKAPHLFCFVTSEPKESEPRDAKRDAPRAYISAWPKDGIRGEISFRMGFPVKADAKGTVAVNAKTYKLFGAEDRAYVKDPTQELKLLDAMRKGSYLKVEVASAEGGTITDTYSLMGISAALQKLQDTCF
jgi:hypothetical protein